jgi:hypothetical protein
MQSVYIRFLLGVNLFKHSHCSRPTQSSRLAFSSATLFSQIFKTNFFPSLNNKENLLTTESSTRCTLRGQFLQQSQEGNRNLNACWWYLSTPAILVKAECNYLLYVLQVRNLHYSQRTSRRFFRISFYWIFHEAVNIHTIQCRMAGRLTKVNDLEGGRCVLIDVLSCNVPGGTEENHNKSEAG